jgi:transposase
VVASGVSTPLRKVAFESGTGLEYSQDDEEGAMGKRRQGVEHLPMMYPNAAGLDIGSCEIYACVPPDRAEDTVKVCGTFTADLNALADWLGANQVDTVALESTGGYWIPAFERLDSRGFKVYLVNARHMKGVPGRKSDDQDGPWIQEVHRVGLLTHSFRPDVELCALRASLRQRADLLHHRALPILHMQPALQPMNIQLPQVLRDITGETGLTIGRASVAGERNGVKVAPCRDPRGKSSADTIAQALGNRRVHGTWKEDHLLALKQAVELYDFYVRRTTASMTACNTPLAEESASEVARPTWMGKPEGENSLSGKGWPEKPFIRGRIPRLGCMGKAGLLEL